MTDIEKEGELFEQWWEDEGQYHRAGGDDYCKTFAWEAWIFVKTQAIPDGFVLVPKVPYAYLIKHKFWQKGSDPEIFLAEEFLGDDGVEKDKLTVCIPLYLGDDEAQEQK